MTAATAGADSLRLPLTLAPYEAKIVVIGAAAAGGRRARAFLRHWRHARRIPARRTGGSVAEAGHARREARRQTHLPGMRRGQRLRPPARQRQGTRRPRLATLPLGRHRCGDRGRQPDRNRDSHSAGRRPRRAIRRSATRGRPRRRGATAAAPRHVGRRSPGGPLDRSSPCPNDGWFAPLLPCCC